MIHSKISYFGTSADYTLWKVVLASIVHFWTFQALLLGTRQDQAQLAALIASA